MMKTKTMFFCLIEKASLAAPCKTDASEPLLGLGGDLSEGEISSLTHMISRRDDCFKTLCERERVKKKFC